MKVIGNCGKLPRRRIDIERVVAGICSFIREDGEVMCRLWGHPSRDGPVSDR